MAEFVRLEVDDGVATIRIDRPKMNALSSQVQEEIREAATEASTRDDVRAVVVYGGEKVFAAGADIIVAQGTEAGGHTGQRATLPLLQEVLAATDRPVLAAGGIAAAARRPTASARSAGMRCQGAGARKPKCRIVSAIRVA